MIWTDPIIASVRQWADAGFTAREIAEKLGNGCTKAAVLGKCWREGIPMSTMPAKMRRSNWHRPRDRGRFVARSAAE